MKLPGNASLLVKACYLLSNCSHAICYFVIVKPFAVEASETSCNRNSQYFKKYEWYFPFIYIYRKIEKCEFTWLNTF